MKYKVAIVDDHKLFREGLKLLLSNINYIDSVIEAENGKVFLDNLDDSKPDIVLMDIDMPEIDGVEATQHAIRRFPDLKVVALSMYGDDAYYYKMIDAGAKGFLLKNSEFDQVKEAIKTVLDGSNYFSEELLYSLIKGFKSNQKEWSNGEELSEREQEILYLICKGFSNIEIADKLFISKRTVDNHRANILFKTNTKNTASLVVYAIKNKLVEI